MKSEARAKFTQRVVRDLKGRSSIGLLFYPIIVCIVVFADDFYLRQTRFTLIFGFSIAGICLFRLGHVIATGWLIAPYGYRNNAVFLASAGATGLIWGAGFAYFMVMEGEHTARLLMSICTAGLSAAGTVAFIPSLRLATFYNLAMLVPAIALMSIRQVNLPLAVSYLMFAVFMVLMANRGNREYWQALENEQLLIQKSDELTALSRIDSLTGLYNRRHFDERLDMEWKKSSRVQHPPTVIICDIDYFKAINDRHGHQAGDEFLRVTADMLRAVFKRDTDIVARFGGEEFIVLLTDCTAQLALVLAEELRLRMALMRMPYKGVDIWATLSIGLASASPESGESRDAIIARADNALYQAKREGRNRTIAAPRTQPPGQPSTATA